MTRGLSGCCMSLRTAATQMLSHPDLARHIIGIVTNTPKRQIVFIFVKLLRGADSCVVVCLCGLLQPTKMGIFVFVATIEYVFTQWVLEKR